MKKLKISLVTIINYSKISARSCLKSLELVASAKPRKSLLISGSEGARHFIDGIADVLS